MEDAILGHLAVQLVGVAAPTPEKPDLVLGVAHSLGSQCSSTTETEARELRCVDAPKRQLETAEDEEEP